MSVKRKYFSYYPLKYNEMYAKDGVKVYDRANREKPYFYIVLKSDADTDADTE